MRIALGTLPALSPGPWLCVYRPRHMPSTLRPSFGPLPPTLLPVCPLSTPVSVALTTFDWAPSFRRRLHGVLFALAHPPHHFTYILVGYQHLGSFTGAQSSCSSPHFRIVLFPPTSEFGVIRIKVPPLAPGSQDCFRSFHLCPANDFFCRESGSSHSPVPRPLPFWPTPVTDSLPPWLLGHCLLPLSCSPSSPFPSDHASYQLFALCSLISLQRCPFP